MFCSGTFLLHEEGILKKITEYPEIVTKMPFYKRKNYYIY